MVRIDLTDLCLGCMEEGGTAATCPHCGFPAGGGPESLLHLPPGTVLEDKYILGRVLGQGGFGITYLAWDKVLSLKLAIKEYLPQQLATRTGGERTVTVFKQSLKEEFIYGKTKFLEEARTLARFIEHPNIVSVRDYFEANGTAYLVMNHHDGVTLHSYLQSRGGRIEAAQAVQIFMPVLDALKVVHALGILHRDISPDNLLINTAGRVILIDFGAARQAMGEKSRSLSVIMKAGYSPEEQYRSRGKQGPWTDIYAVAATMYRAVTGQVPPEAMDRLAEDDLVPPSQLGVDIGAGLEQALLKALAVRAEERYQGVEEFQAALAQAEAPSKSPNINAQILEIDLTDDDLLLEPRKGEDLEKELFINREEAVSDVAKKLEVKDHVTCSTCGGLGAKSGRECLPCTGTGEIARVKTVTINIPAGVSDGARYRLKGQGGPGVNGGPDGDLFLTVRLKKAVPLERKHQKLQINGIDSIYMIDHQSGSARLSDLPIGARVYDPTWEWEFRTGDNYTGHGEQKSVSWIVVAKNHYGPGSGVTLLAEELVGKYCFDEREEKIMFGQTTTGGNRWDLSGDYNASRGLRSWLNATGNHADEGFYRAFSAEFKRVVLNTTVPNKEWQNGNAYSTSDNVFIPTTTEMGDTEHNYTHPIGKSYAYFQGANNAKKVAMLGGEIWWYWTRSPDLPYGYGVRLVNSDSDFSYGRALSAGHGVRPALNLKSEVLVSEIRN